MYFPLCFIIGINYNRQITLIDKTSKHSNDINSSDNIAEYGKSVLLGKH